MPRPRLSFLFLNAGHFVDHFFMLIFATVAALRLAGEWGMSYAALIPYATPGFIAFGIGAIPAGWLADKWSREGMIVIFFFGIGASSILTALAGSPIEIALGLAAIGLFAAIYHPVGLALVIQGREKTGVPLAINGIFGNLGVACAALLTGYFIDTAGWRNAFVLPGVISIGLGFAYAGFVWSGRGGRAAAGRAGGGFAKSASGGGVSPVERATFVRVLAIIMFTTAIGGLIFQSTTFALPKIFDERLADLAGSATAIGGYAFGVFTVAAFAQLAVGYLVDHHSLRTVFAFVAGAAGGVLRDHVPAHRGRRPHRGSRFHARRVRADPDQRRAHRADHEERVAKPRLFRPLHRDVLRERVDPPAHCLDSWELGIRPPLRGDGRRGVRHTRGGHGAAAPGCVHRTDGRRRVNRPPGRPVPSFSHIHSGEARADSGEPPETGSELPVRWSTPAPGPRPEIRPDAVGAASSDGSGSASSGRPPAAPGSAPANVPRPGPAGRAAQSALRRDPTRAHPTSTGSTRKCG